MHFFSIIIPHFNIPQLLQRCLDSIPDTPEVQVIVVDDNSSPDKVNFEKFPGQERQYTQCIFDKEGGGAGHARNIGLRHADGRWLVFADADDFFTKEAFAILDKHKDDSHDIILFKSNSVNSDDLLPSNRYQDVNEAIDYALSDMISAKQAVLKRPGPVCKMFRNSYIHGKNIWFDETMASNDMMFVAKATCWAEDDAVAVATDVLYTVTTRANSLMDNWKKDPENYLCRLEVLIRYHEFVKGSPEFKKDPIIIVLARSWNYGIKTFFRALALVLRRKALFYGFNDFLKTVYNHILKL